VTYPKQIEEKQIMIDQIFSYWRNFGFSIGGLSHLSYCTERITSFFFLAGIIHAAEEKDWKTAYSYFYEAFEGYDSIDSPRAITALKYMLLCKIMLSLWVLAFSSVSHFSFSLNLDIEHVKPVYLYLCRPEDVQALISGKLALRYAGRQVDVW